MEKLKPVKNNEREFFMDALRGFAILGIFIANLAGFSRFESDDTIVGPWIINGADDIMRFLHYLFIEGKFYSIFSLLFGWGIALQIKRGVANGINSVKTVKRRLLIMLLLGAFHLLIWPGDIVFFYALLGFLFLPLRKFSNKTLLVTASILIVSPIVLYALKMHFQWLNFPSQLCYRTGNQLETALLGINSEASYAAFEQNATWFDIVKGNIAGFFYRYGYLIFVSRIPKVLGVFLIGYVIGRTNFYTNLQQNKKIVHWVIAIGFFVGLPANFMLARYMSAPGDLYFGLTPNGWLETVSYALGVVPLALAYVATLVILSTIWLSYFQYGPVEWVWRSLTYGKRQPMLH
jgi:uncharacterized protein